MSKREPKILVIGYSKRLKGGVVNATESLRAAFPEMDLLPSLHCYTPRSTAFLLYLTSILKFSWLMLGKKRYNIIQLIVGSTGDAIRMVPFVWLSKIRGYAVCAQYHKDLPTIVNPIRNSVYFKIIIWAMQSLDLHCFLSNKLGAQIGEILDGNPRTVVIPNILPAAWLNLAPIPLELRTRDIVFFGRWHEEKGISDLIEGIGRLDEDWVCECYTDGPNPGPERFVIHGWVEEPEARSAMRSARLLVLPSHAEAFPYVILEAAACGTPFIASDVGGIEDMVYEGQAGKTFPVGDIDEFVRLMQEALGKPSEWNAMSRNGVDWVSEFSQGMIKEKWLSAYKSIISD